MDTAGRVTVTHWCMPNSFSAMFSAMHVHG